MKVRVQDRADNQPEFEFRPYPADIALAHEQAAKCGMEYEAYVKMLLHEALTCESKAS
jgi:hypothetical protein